MDERKRHVVVGAGPVGRAVVAALVARGELPVVVTRSGAGVPGAEARAGNVADPVSAVEVLADAAVVFHCAQPPYHRWPEEFPALQTGVLGGGAAAGATVVAVENLYGYGPVTDRPYREDLPLVATTRKGAVRARLSEGLLAAHRRGDVRAVAARASDFFGPHVEGSLYGERFFGPLVAGRRAEVLGDPDTLHAVTYVPDLGEAMVRLAADEASHGRAWHVPNAPAVTQRALVSLAAERAGTASDPKVVPAWQLRLAGLFVPAVREVLELRYEVEHDHLVDSSAYVARFGDHATPLGDALTATVRWYQESAGARR